MLIAAREIAQRRAKLDVLFVPLLNF